MYINTNEGVGFKEFEIGDVFFFNNRLWEKGENRQARIIESKHGNELGVWKTFTSNCTCYISIYRNEEDH
jgi:hypothetical protein